ncbi:MAG: hypothetical protein V1913_05975 [Fibrobacterota bacterium]
MRNNSRSLVLLIVLGLLCSTLQALDDVAPSVQSRGMAPASVAVDSVRAVTAETDSLPMARVIKKDLNPKEQVLIGTSIMAFIVVVMAFMNNFNPE